MAAYQLSEYGRAVTWRTWESLNACGLPGTTNAYKTLGPQVHWRKDLTLGEIEDACPATGRALARYAKDRMKMDEFVKPYERGITPPIK